MIDFYYWTTPNGHKITLFLEEAGLKYRVNPINIGKGDQFDPEFLKIAPNNRIPAIVDHAPTDGGEPISLFESGAILEYLADKTGQFLSTAFSIAIFLMALILITQFNSLYQASLVLSAIVFSTAGVLLGLLITGQPFGIVMVGVGIIALAGIVVNNNIVLIDCYNDLRKQGRDPLTAALETGSLRLRPVLLTAVTTVLGLMPMVLAMNIDLLNRTIAFGAPSTQWWTQLSTAIAGGLSFATVLTLFLTPCLLVLGERRWLPRLRWKKKPKPELAVN